MSGQMRELEVQDESASPMVEGVGGDEAEVGAEVEAVVEKAQREEELGGAEHEEHEWAVEMSTGKLSVYEAVRECVRN